MLTRDDGGLLNITEVRLFWRRGGVGAWGCKGCGWWVEEVVKCEGNPSVCGAAQKAPVCNILVQYQTYITQHTHASIMQSAVTSDHQMPVTYLLAFKNDPVDHVMCHSPTFGTGGSVLEVWMGGEWGVGGSCLRGVSVRGDNKWGWEAVRLVWDAVGGSLFVAIASVDTGAAVNKQSGSILQLKVCHSKCAICKLIT